MFIYITVTSIVSFNFYTEKLAITNKTANMMMTVDDENLKLKFNASA